VERIFIWEERSGALAEADDFMQLIRCKVIVDRNITI